MDSFEQWDPDWQMLDQLIEDICDDSSDEELADMWDNDDWDGVKDHLLRHYEAEIKHRIE
jgi:hypothetical protein